jgi:hypothetical protein
MVQISDNLHMPVKRALAVSEPKIYTILGTIYDLQYQASVLGPLRHSNQGSLTEGEGSVQLTSLFKQV